MKSVLSFAAFALLASGCQKTEFKSPSGPAAPPSYKVPTGEGLPQVTPIPYEASDKSKVCGNKHLATRMVFVIDNSRSHREESAAVKGSDPVKTALSSRGKVEALTRRQDAVFSAAEKTAKSDQEAVASEPEFYGSDIGITYFPRGDASMDDYNSYVIVTGPGNPGAAAFPDVMTNMRTVGLTPDFRNAAWSALDFTHDSKGATPYLTALKGAKEVLESSRKEGDPRREIVVFITDGLPTDTSPKAVKEMVKSEFKDKGIILITVFVFVPGAKQDMTDTPAYTTLQTEFNGPRKWGQEDGYTQFPDYWQALVNIPREMADHFIEVRDASILKDQIAGLLEKVQTCE